MSLYSSAEGSWKGEMVKLIPEFRFQPVGLGQCLLETFMHACIVP